jgi:hypothetical protein
LSRSAWRPSEVNGTERSYLVRPTERADPLTYTWAPNLCPLPFAL